MSRRCPVIRTACMRRRGDGVTRLALIWPPTAYLLLLFVAPTLIMVLAAFRFPGDYGGLMPLVETTPDGAWTLLIDHHNWREFLTFESWQRLAESPLYLNLFLRSVGYALVTTLICVLCGYPLAWLISTSPRKRRDLMILLVILPFWSNFLVRVYAWMTLLGPQGFLSLQINRWASLWGAEPVQVLFSPVAVIIVLVYVHLPFMILPLYANLEKHDPAWLDAARDLGANAWQRFWRVTWPLSLPGVYAGSALVFIPALGMFAVPDLVGGTDGIMIGNLIKQQFIDSRDWPFGSVLSLMLTLAILVLAGLLARLGGRSVSHGH